MKKNRQFNRHLSLKKILCCVMVMLCCTTTLFAQNPKVTIDANGITVKELLSKIESEIDYSFAYATNVLDLNKKVNVHAKDRDVEAVLLSVIPNIEIQFDGNKIIILTKNAISPPQKKSNVMEVKGLVVDELGAPLIGATVIANGGQAGTTTNVSGEFMMKIKPSSTLEVSYLGYKPQEMGVGGRSYLVVTLGESKNTLTEVVVVGYGTQTKANLTGAVTTVDVSKTFESRPQTDVAKALQGAVPGLTILNSSGNINDKPTISIRGTGTLSNDAKSAPLYVVDGVPMDDISYLNTQDIQSISVLKDAASTSIYGTRAAFGVILINTKSAKKVDRVSVNYSANFAWGTPTVLPDYPDVASQASALRYANTRASLPNELFGMYMDDEFINKANGWKARHGGKAGYREMIPGDDFDLSDSGKGLYYADWDVVGIMFRDWSPEQSHHLSVSGTSGKTSYILSLGYSDKEGVMTFNPDQLTKYNTSMNINSEVTKWLQVGGRFSYSNKIYTEPNTRRDTYTYMWRWGSFFGPYGTYDGLDSRNDIAYRKQAGDDRTSDAYTRIGAYLKATITKGLTLNVDYTHMIMNHDRKIVGLPVTVRNTWGGDIRTPTTFNSGSGTYVKQVSALDKSYALNVFANYELTFNQNHNFNFMVGTNVEEGEYNSHWSQRNNLLDGNLPEFNLATGDQTVGGSHNHWGTAGYFARVNYNYKSIWLLELNGRYDGSSKFPSNNRWAFFPSASMGYRFSEESYFEPIKKVVTHAKLRASFGEIGNQAIGSNMFISTLGNVKLSDTDWIDATGNKVTAYNMPSLVSEILQWERIQTLDVGLDFGLFDNKINVSADWYQRTTLDMLAPSKTMPQVLGALAPKINAGTLRTRGWELNVGWNQSFNEVNLYANVNVGDFKTVITEWDNDSQLLNEKYSGQVYGDIWGFETDRFFTASDFNADGTFADGVPSQAGLQQGSFKYGAGDVKFKDLDGDGVITGGSGSDGDHGDLKVIGNTTPRYQYGIRLGGSWKGIDIDMFFQGVGQQSLWTQSAFVMPMMRGADAIYDNQTNYWTEDNTNAEFPRLWPGNAGKGTISVLENGNNNFYPQSRYLVDRSYLRLKNLTVGYTLPQTWTRKAYIERVRVYFSADNLCELINNSNAPLDPEINGAGLGSTDYGNGTWGRIDPLFRTMSFGLQVTF